MQTRSLLPTLSLFLVACGPAIPLPGAGGSGGTAGEGQGADAAPMEDAAPTPDAPAQAPDGGAGGARACSLAAASPRCTAGFLCADSQTCWTGRIDCGTARDCDGDGKLDIACPCGQFVDCAARTCADAPGTAPATCAKPAEDARCSGDLGLLCVHQEACVRDPEVDCSSLRDCDGDGLYESTCPCGQVVDCATRTCKTPGR
jgi:hypothetical protein